MNDKTILPPRTEKEIISDAVTAGARLYQNQCTPEEGAKEIIIEECYEDLFGWRDRKPKLALNAPAAHSLFECLSELKFGRTVDDQKLIDSFIAKLNIIDEPEIELENSCCGNHSEEEKVEITKENIKIVMNEPEPKGKLIHNLKVNVHVQSISKIPESSAKRLITAYGGNVKHKVKYLLSYLNFNNTPTPKRKAYLTYPLDVVVEVDIIKGDSVGKILWQLAQAYVDIYKDSNKYGIWGHGMGDLYFETIRIYDNKIEVGMGS